MLRNKKDGQSEEAAPDESVNSLRNFDHLLASDPLVNSIHLLARGSDSLASYSKQMNIQTTELNKLTKILIRESRNISRPATTGKPEKIQKSINAVYDGMGSYSKQLQIRIPNFSKFFSSISISVLRVIKLVQENELEQTLPLGGVTSSMLGAQNALKEMIAAIVTVEQNLNEWPIHIVDLDIQKKIIVALHQDLVESLSKSVELLDRLMEEAERSNATQ